MAFDRKREPVRHIRKWRGGYGAWMKYPKTTAEHRMNQHVDDDEPKCRINRGANVLTDSWDDRPITRQRSWKAHRQHQHK